MLSVSSTQPLVTVTIPTYNYGRFLKCAIDSVLAQTYPDIEIIILDNASTDNTQQIAAKYSSHPQFQYIRHEQNIGVNANWSQALKSGSGKYVVILSADDFLYPNHIETLVNALEEHPQCDLAYTPCYWVDEKGQVIQLLIHRGHKATSYYGGRNEFAELLVYDSYITPSAAVIRRSAADRVGGIDPKSQGGGDWDLWVRLAISNPEFIFIQRPSAAYRVHSDQTWQIKTAKPLQDHLRLLEKSLAGPQKDRLHGYETSILELFQARIAEYPPEVLRPLRARIQTVTQQFERLARKKQPEPSEKQGIATQARETLKTLLESTDILNALEENRATLNDELSNLIQDEIHRARKRKNNATLEKLQMLQKAIAEFSKPTSAEPAEEKTTSTETGRNIFDDEGKDLYKANLPEEAIPLARSANKLLREGKHAEALETFEQALLVAPDNPWLLTLRAVPLIYLKMYPQAQLSLLKATEIQPNNKQAWQMLGALEQSSHPIADASARTTKSSPPAIHGQPLVSVIVPTYNRPEELARALQSIVNQDYPNHEIIVINDAGKDVSQIVAPFSQQHQLTYIQMSENRGASAARNAGIQAAQGKYIAFLDDDDHYQPHHLSTLVAELEQDPTLSAVYANSLQATIKKQNGQTQVIDKSIVYSVDFSGILLISANYIPILNLVVRKAAVQKAGYFDERLMALEDWEWLIRLAQTGPFKHIPVTTAEYVVRADQRSRNILLPDQIYKLYLQIYARHAHLIAPKTLKKCKEVYARMTKRDLSSDLPPLFSPHPVFPTSSQAAIMLQMLENADDVKQVIASNASFLNDELIVLLCQKAAEANLTNQPEQAQRVLDSIYIIEQQRTKVQKPMSDEQRAAETLQMLLDSEDILASLEKNQERLDQHLLKLVLQNQRAAIDSNETDLADGLGQLADYIQSVLGAGEKQSSGQGQTPGQTTASDFVPASDPEKTLMLLLEADDLEIALQQYASRLDAPLLDLVRRAADEARQDNEQDLADGLTALAEYIANVLSERQ